MKVNVCKPVPGGMTEQEKAEAGLLYNPNETDELKAFRFTVQDKIWEYNQLKPSQVQERRDFLAKIFGKIGEKCNILPPCKCDYGFHIEVGENFFANFHLTVLDEAPVTIGNKCFIGPNVGIYTACHPLEAGERDKWIEWAEPVTIGDSVWIGGGVTICPGVTIGDNCVIGAGSVVVKDIPANSVAVGNPAHVVKKVG